MADQFVTIPVPVELASTVMRLVADHLDGAKPDVSSRDDDRWGIVDPWSRLVDEAESAIFWQALRPADRRLLKFLAEQPKPVAAADVAQALGLDVATLAGVVGPLNKGAVAAGFPAPVASQTVTSTTPGGRRRVRMLSIPPGLAEMVRANGTEPQESPTAVASVRRRPRSKAAIELFGRAVNDKAEL